MCISIYVYMYICTCNIYAQQKNRDSLCFHIFWRKNVALHFCFWTTFGGKKAQNLIILKVS